MMFLDNAAAAAAADAGNLIVQLSSSRVVQKVELVVHLSAIRHRVGIIFQSRMKTGVVLVERITSLNTERHRRWNLIHRMRLRYSTVVIVGGGGGDGGGGGGGGGGSSCCCGSVGGRGG